MSKQSDPLTKLYSRLFIGIGRLGVLFLLAALVVFAGFLGFAVDFGSCFGKATCSNNAGMYFLILPLGVIIFAIYGLYKWQSRREKQYKNSVRNEVLEELGQEASDPEQRIIRLLDERGALTLAELSTLTEMDQEKLVIILRDMLQQHQVRQILRDNQAYFTRSR